MIYPHHVVEDVAIVLGQALNDALGNKVGIERFGSADIPMDETLATCVVDLSGRAYFVLNLQFDHSRVEDMASEDLQHFFETFANNAKMNLHIWIHYGTNMHGKSRNRIKSFAHALKNATKITSNQLMSTKGTLSQPTMYFLHLLVKQYLLNKRNLHFLNESRLASQKDFLYQYFVHNVLKSY